MSKRLMAALLALIAVALSTILVGVAHLDGDAVDGQHTWLLYTKSAGFEHNTIKRKGDAPSFLFTQLEPLFAARGFKLIESKDGRLFEPDATTTNYAGYVFYTSGDLTTKGTDKQPPMSAAGKKFLLDRIAAGTPFIGLHSASITFRVKDSPDLDPFLKTLGGNFVAHGDQQPSTATIVDASFPGIGTQADWTFTEEWYALERFASDIHPIQTLETAGMKGEMYARAPHPITWTHTWGKGRVFYTAIGHREDVISSNAYLNLIGGAIDWCRAAR